MPAGKRHRETLVVLFVAAVLALNYPLLAIFDQMLMPLGIPLLYLYLFLVWLAIIVATALVMRRSGGRSDGGTGR